MRRRSPRWRLIALGLAALLFAGTIHDLILFAGGEGRHAWVGIDVRVYLDATQRWLTGGSFYLPHQLAGPYTIAYGDVLYPPTAIPLFAPFLVLPAVLWWAVPIAGIAAVSVASRPSPTVIAAMALCLWFPTTMVRIVTGNPVMWIALFAALAWRWPAFGPWVLLKPSLFPFALIGAPRRWWWVGLVAYGALALVTLPLMAQWVTVLLNSRGGGLLYSLQDVPLVCIGMLAGMSGWVRSRAPEPRLVPA